MDSFYAPKNEVWCMIMIIWSMAFKIGFVVLIMHSKKNKLDFNPWHSRVILATCIQRRVVKHSSSFLWAFKIEILRVVLRTLKCFVLTLDHSRLFLTQKWKWLFGLWFSFKILCSSLHVLSPKMIFLDCFDAWKT